MPGKEEEVFTMEILKCVCWLCIFVCVCVCARARACVRARAWVWGGDPETAD